MSFDQFWKIYPRRVAKFSARRAWDKARKHVAAEILIDGARRYAADRKGADPKYTKHPATWLNGGCWDDEPPEGNYRDEHSVLAAFDRLEQALAGADDNAPGQDDLLGLSPRRLCGPG